MLGDKLAKTLRGSRMEDVIFAGTRDRNPTGMAEVSLTLIDPEVYSGADSNAPTEIEIQDDFERRELGRSRVAYAGRGGQQRPSGAVEEAQPGKTEEVERAGECRGWKCGEWGSDN